MSKKSASKSIKKPIKDTTFSNYIYKVLKNIQPDLGISSNGMLVLSRISLYIVKRYAELCSSILTNSRKKTVNLTTIYAASYIIYESIANMEKNFFADEVLKRMDKAVDLYNKSNNDKTKERKEFKAGLQISVSILAIDS